MPLNERTLAKPLSGAEIREAIIHKLREQMQRDCFLAPHIAYASFSFQLKLDVQFQNTGTSIKETTIRATDAGGEVIAADMEHAELAVSGEPQPPNEVRVETGQGVPTVVQKPQGGIEERKVKYDPKSVQRQVPRGKVAR